VDHVVDPGSFEPVTDDLVARDPLAFPGYSKSIEDAGTSGRAEAVLAGAGTIMGHEVEVASFDFRFLGGSMGEVVGERITRAVERAIERHVPFILRTATGGARMQEGMRALIQMPKLIAARAALGTAGLPYIAVLGDPTTGGVLASIGALADYTVAEAGATIGFAGPRVVEVVTGAVPSAASHNAAAALGNGLVDAVVEPGDARTLVGMVLDVLSMDTPEPVGTPPTAEPVPMDGWAAVRSARAPERPSGAALGRGMADAFIELHGDRAGHDDGALFAALGRIKGRRALILGLDRAAPRPAAFRTAQRCLSIATRLGLPVVTVIDTPGADPSESSESAGIAWAIGGLFESMLSLPVPVVCVVSGEGGSGGALAFACGDVLLMYGSAVFSVIQPEAAAAILWRDSGRAEEAANVLHLTAHDLSQLGIADAILPEPPDARRLADAVAYHLDRLTGSEHELAATRRGRWRHMGGY
jgi:acetyl-CoA carboxylase carboxyl transferase subunit beta